MVQNRKYQRLVPNGECQDNCRLSDAYLGKGEAALVLRDIEEGYSNVEIAAKHAERDNTMPFSHAAAGRHRKNHLVSTDEITKDESLGELTELEALRLAVKQGQKNMRNWNMTPSEWMKALELLLRVTEGTVHDAMNEAIAAASMEDDEDDERDAPAAVRPGGVEAAGAASQSLRAALPDGPAPSGAVPVAEPLERSGEHARAGEPVGEDVRHRDEAHPQERVQGGLATDGAERMA